MFLDHTYGEKFKEKNHPEAQTNHRKVPKNSAGNPPQKKNFHRELQKKVERSKKCHPFYLIIFFVKKFLETKIFRNSSSEIML